MTTILIVALILFYILAGIFLTIIAGFCGLKVSKPKNILLLIFYPIGMWFLK